MSKEKEELKAMKLATCGLEIIALEDGSGVVISGTSGPEDLVASAYLGIQMNLLAGGFTKEMLEASIEMSVEYYGHFTAIRDKAIEGGADKDEAHNVMVANMNHELAKMAVDKANEDGSLDEAFKEDEGKATEEFAKSLGVNQKIIV